MLIITLYYLFIRKNWFFMLCLKAFKEADVLVTYLGYSTKRDRHMTKLFNLGLFYGEGALIFKALIFYD